MHPLLTLDPSKIFECTIIKRLNRFTVLVEASDGLIQAHLNNTGRLYGILEPGRRGVLMNINGVKLRHRLLGVYNNEEVILLDTSIQEKAFLKAAESGLIPWLNPCSLIKRNIRINQAVIDFLFKCGNTMVFIELKSAVMNLNGYSGYPDAPTERGRRQIRVLSELASTSVKSIVVFVSSVPGARGFKLYCGFDKEIGRVVRDAVAKGVLFKAVSISFNHSTYSIMLENPDLTVDLWSMCEE